MAPPGGCVFPGGAPSESDKLIAFETNLMKLQIQMEETFIGNWGLVAVEVIFEAWKFWALLREHVQPSFGAALARPAWQ